MTITELIPTVQRLSHTDKLLLLQILVQELIKSEGVDTEGTDSAQQITGSYEASQSSVVRETPNVSESLVTPLTLEERRAFLQQPLEERQRLLAQQAEAMADHYTQDPEWQALMAGDIIDY